MLDPRSTSPGSIMPAYPWLFDTNVDMSELAPKMMAMKSLGVPYDDSTANDPVAAYRQQAQGISENLAKDGVTVVSDAEIVALIAYMQKLGRDYNKDAVQEASR
jgi:cytochrome c oxidase cbb3-type subunit I/II